MAKFLPVAPANYLENILSVPRIQHKGAFLLAHEVVKDPQAYRNVSYWWEHSQSHTILDNSVIELGGAVDFEMVKSAQDVVGAEVVVLPDVLEDADRSIEATIDALPEWYDYFSHCSTKQGNVTKLMFVPQGETFLAWLRCLETVMQLSEEMETKIRWIGIPRNTTQRIVKSRNELVEIVNALYPDVKIHLLGFSDYLWDDVISARNPHVSSIDSAVPFRMEDFKMFIAAGPRGDWWETAKKQLLSEIPSCVRDNAVTMNNWVTKR